MKKISILLLALFCITITGCTINVDTDKEKDNEIKEIEELNKGTKEEKIKSKGVKSTKDEPLSIGKIGRASKHNVLEDKYLDVDVKLLKVYDNPDKIIEEYNKNNQDDVIKKIEGYKYVVIDYEVTLVDFKTEEFGTDASLDVEIADVNNKEFVVNDVKQIITVNTLKDDGGVTDGSTGTVQIAFQIPNNIKNYLVKLGTISHTIAYYKI